MTDLKVWKCKNGHAMGQVRWKGHGESQLYLFRASIDLNDEHPDLQEVVAILEGYVAATVICSICAQSRTWVPGADALERLIASHRRMIQNQARAETGAYPDLEER